MTPGADSAESLAQGFEIRESVFGRGEMQRLLDSIASRNLPRSRAGSRHVLAAPEVSAIARDSRMSEIASEWLDGRAIPFKATLFDKSTDTNWLVSWHQDVSLPLKKRIDVPGWGPWLGTTPRLSLQFPRSLTP